MALNGLLNFGMLFQARTNLPRVAKQIAVGVSQVERSVNAFTKRGRGGRAAAMAEEQSAIGRGLIRTGIPLAFAAAVISSVNAASDLETQLNRVQIVASQLNLTNKELTDRFIDISNVTGIAARDLGEIAEIAGTTGLAAKISKDQFFDFVDTVAKFGIVTKQSARVAGRQLSDLALQLKLFERGPAVFGRFTSALQLVGKNSASNAKQVAEFAQALVPLVSKTGIALNEILGLAGAIRSFGGEVTKSLIKTNIAGIFQIAALNTAKFAKAMGKSVRDTEILLETNPFEFFLQLLQVLKPLQGNVVLFDRKLKQLGLTSKRIGPLLAGATGQIDLIRRLSVLAKKDLAGLGNTLEIDFQRAMNGAQKQMQRFSAILGNIKIAIGTPLLRAFTGMLKMVNAIGTAINKFLLTGFGQVITQILSLSILAGGIKVFGIVIAAAFGAMQTTLGAIGIAMAGVIFLSAKFFALLKLGAVVLDRVFGRAVRKVFQNITLIGDALKKITTVGITIPQLRTLKDRGLFPIVQAIVEMRDNFDAFIVGFAKGFGVVDKTIGGIALKLVAKFFNVLRQLGIITVASSDGGLAMTELGVRMGLAFTKAIDFGATLIEVVLALADAIVGLVESRAFSAFVGGFAGLATGGIGGAAAGFAAGLITPFKIGGAKPTLARPSGPGSRIPITGTVAPGRAAGDVLGEVPFIEEQLERFGAQRGQVLLRAEMTGDVIIDGAIAGHQLQRAGARVRVRQGAMRPTSKPNRLGAVSDLAPTGSFGGIF